MKNKSFVFYFIIAGIMVCLSACSMFMSNETGDGNISISLGGTPGNARFFTDFRKIFPEFDSVTVSVSRDGNLVKSQTFSNGLTEVSISVPSGVYDITVDAAAKTSEGRAEYYGKTYSGTARNVSIKNGNNSCNVHLSLSETNAILPTISNSGNEIGFEIGGSIMDTPYLKIIGNSDLDLDFIPFYEYDRYGNLYIAYKHESGPYDPTIAVFPFKIDYFVKSSPSITDQEYNTYGIRAVQDINKDVTGMAYYNGGNSQGIFYTIQDSDGEVVYYAPINTMSINDYESNPGGITTSSISLDGKILGDTGFSSQIRSPLAIDKNGNMYAITVSVTGAADYTLSRFPIQTSSMYDSLVIGTRSASVNLDSLSLDRYYATDMKVIGDKLYILRCFSDSSLFDKIGKIDCFDLNDLNKPPVTVNLMYNSSNIDFPARFVGWQKDTIFIYTGDPNSVGGNDQFVLEFNTRENRVTNIKQLQ